MKGVTFATKLASVVLAASVLFFSQAALSENTAQPIDPVKQAEVAKPSASTKPAHAHEAVVTGTINLNKADVRTLTQLNGIGEKKAQAIIAYRESKGGFKSVDELLNVKGIGQKILDKNRSILSVN